MFVRELADGQEIDQVLLVRERERRSKRDGSEYLKLSLGDRTGCVSAVVWEGAPSWPRCCEAGAAVRVAGRYERAPALRRADRRARAAPRAAGRVRARATCSTGRRARRTQMEADLRELVATVQNPHLRALLDRVLGPDAPAWPLYRDAPAAKRYHQAYRHGLLEHCLSVAQAVSAISATFPGIDRDVAVTGALLHDIGKLEAYTAGPAGDRHDRPRQAPGRDPARLLPDPPR